MLTSDLIKRKDQYIVGKGNQNIMKLLSFILMSNTVHKASIPTNEAYHHLKAVIIINRKSFIIDRLI